MEDNPDIGQFESSVLNGIYVTRDVDQCYLNYLELLRHDDSKVAYTKTENRKLEIHNES